MSDGEQIPAFDSVVDMELTPEDERCWIVLFDEDYGEFLYDADDSVAMLVDCNQAVEILKLASEAVAGLAPESAPDKEPIDAMIDELEAVQDDD